MLVGTGVPVGSGVFVGVGSGVSVGAKVSVGGGRVGTVTSVTSSAGSLAGWAGVQAAAIIPQTKINSRVVAVRDMFSSRFTCVPSNVGVQDELSVL